MKKIVPFALCSLFLVTACEKEDAPPKGGPDPSPTAAEMEVPKETVALFAALPEKFEAEDNPITPAKVELGRMLYYDARLSKNHDISCNSCHKLDAYGVDGEPTSPGHKKQRGDRNSPTVYNAGLLVAQFWDGRAEDLEAQAKGPVMNPVEMAMPDEDRVRKTLSSIPAYVAAFEKAFPGEKEPVSLETMAAAIGAFERGLVTPSRFDAFLEGKEEALTAEEKKGLVTFVNTGCVACHTGAGVGGTAFHKLGQVKPWPKEEDLGRFEVTEKEADKMVFRVPTLRNVAKTGPYFHDGSVKTLDEAVKLMARHQLGKELSDDDTKAIVTFLGALTGELPADYIKKPELPKSTGKTPKPDPS